MEDLIQEAKVVLANHQALALKAHNYHWNVQGPDFKQYHDLFAGVYEEINGAIDVLAEEIRAMNSYAPASFSRFLELTEVADENTVPDALEMVRRLYADVQTVRGCVTRAYDLAENYKLHGYSNLMAERQDKLLKHEWMLRATLKNTI